MGVVTNTDKFAKAISKYTGIREEEFEVRSFHPAHGNKQNATIVLKDSDVEKLIEMGKIRFGWTQSKRLKRKNDIRSYRCWNIDT